MKISAIIRTKNSAQTLGQCLDSLIHQTLHVNEIVIVDSGSTDATLSIVEQYRAQYGEQYSYKIIYYPSDEEFSYSKALNLGIAQASGDHILILSSHVVLKHQNTLELMLAIWQNWQTACAISLCRDTVPTVTQPPHPNNVKWSLINRDNFRGQGMYNFCSMIRKSDWETYRFNEDIPRCEDQDWVLHFYKQNNTGSLIIHHPTVYYNNPYYNATKDAWDYIVLGHYIDRYFVSKQFVYKILGNALQELKAFHFSKAIYYFRIAEYIVRDRLQGTPNIRSIYNADLEVKAEINAGSASASAH